MSIQQLTKELSQKENVPEVRNLFPVQSGELMVSARRADSMLQSVIEGTSAEIATAFMFDAVLAERAETYRAEQERVEVQRRELTNVVGSIKSLGSAGRLFIPSVDLDVALTASSLYSPDVQALTDMEDNATYFAYDGLKVIADHVNQGFWKMKEAVVGARAYIKTSDGIRTYVCIANISGHNTGSALTDDNYNSISHDNPGGLAMYTCNGGWQNIIITLWQPE